MNQSAWHQPPAGADRAGVQRGRALSWGGCGLMVAAFVVLSCGAVLAVVGYDSEPVLWVMGLAALGLGLLIGVIGMALNWYGFIKYLMAWWRPG